MDEEAHEKLIERIKFLENAIVKNSRLELDGIRGKILLKQCVGRKFDFHIDQALGHNPNNNIS